MKTINESLRLEITKKENSLWEIETRANKQYMEELLHPDFIEFGRSGKKYDRIACIKALVGDFTTKIPLPEIDIKMVSEDVLLVHYISEAVFTSGKEIARRTSVWKKVDKDWLLLFHQGTPL